MAGMGSQFSGGKNGSNKLSWKNPEMKTDKTKLKSSGPMKRQPDHYNKLSTNPSGASNTRTMP